MNNNINVNVAANSTSACSACGYPPAQNLFEANKVMRIMRKEQREIDKIHAAAEAQREELRKEMRMIDDWEQSSRRSHENEMAFFKSRLVGFVSKELDGSKKKSIKLVGGSAGYSPLRGEYVFPSGEDKPGASNKVLLDFLKENHLDAFLETKVSEKVRWGDLKKALKASPDGLDVEVNGITIPHLAKKLEGGEFFVKLDEDSSTK